jgi:N-acyl-D-amino-acid deacylase
MLAILLFVAFPQPSNEAIRDAISRSLVRLEAAALNYTTHRDCFSCHHQAVPLFAFEAAKTKGFRIDPQFLERQYAFTLDTFKPNLEQIRKGNRVPGGNTMTGYALETLRIGGKPNGEVIDALLDYLIERQQSDGSWPALAQRVPSEGSKFTNAAHAIAALKHYRLNDEASKKAVAKGIEWVKANAPKETEDVAFRLKALFVAGVDIAEARQALLDLQRPDGGWSQNPKLPSDAYATGSVLSILAETGTSTKSIAYRRGVAYLLKTQQPTGAWIVDTRIRPVQKMFDNGDPGGQSQFISTAATSWATLALILGLER